MATDLNDRSFGRYLRARRLERGISLKDVARQTRIGMETLLAIEREDHQALPAPVFVKGFLRAVSRVIGADADTAVQRYENSVQDLEAALRFEQDLVRIRRRHWPRLALALGGLMLIIGISIYLFSDPGPRETPSSPQPSVPEAPAPDQGPAKVDPPPRVEMQDRVPAVEPEVPVEPALPAAPQAAPPEPSPARPPDAQQVLEVRAREEVWLKVIVDRERPREFILAPDDDLRLEAARTFSLLIGNAGGVELKLNGKPIPVTGKSGQVVTLELP